MDAPESYNNCDRLSPNSTTVKVEPASLDIGHSLLHSPPSSRSSPRATRYSTTTSPTRYKRKHSQSFTRSELSIMTHPYGNWSSAGLKDEQNPGHRGFSGGVQSSGSNRRGGSGDQQHFYNPESYSQPVSTCVLVPLFLSLINHSMTSTAAQVLDTSLRSALRVFLGPWETSACQHIHLLLLLRPVWHGRLPRPLGCPEATSLRHRRRRPSLLTSPLRTHSFIRTVRQTHYYHINNIIRRTRDLGALRMLFPRHTQINSRISSSSRGRPPCSHRPSFRRRFRRHRLAWR